MSALAMGDVGPTATLLKAEPETAVSRLCSTAAPRRSNGLLASAPISPPATRFDRGAHDRDPISRHSHRAGLGDLDLGAAAPE